MSQPSATEVRFVADTVLPGAAHEWGASRIVCAGPAGFRVLPGIPSGADASGVLRLAGTVLPAFTDSHVHLGLLDDVARGSGPGSLRAGGIARVVDLGWLPEQVAGWAAQAHGVPATDPHLDVAYAGAFLAAPGGYPATRSWAPGGSVREISDTGEAISAIVDMVALGASTIKVTLNSDAGPVLDDALLRTVVTAAHSAGLPVVAHTEGAGQARRAALAGVDTLAHTPFSERLDDDTISMMATRSAWISTLDIHGWGTHTDAYAVAIDNLARFVASGGRVLYGTDLGNGPLPVGLNPRELAALCQAGLTLTQVLAALTPATVAPAARRTIDTDTDTDTNTNPGLDLGTQVTWIPGPRPTTPAADPDPATIIRWLASAEVIAVSELEERFV